MKKVNEALLSIQREFKSVKDRYNQFGQFKYRTAETMYASLKPLLDNYKCLLTFNEEPVAVGSSLYIKCTARLISLEDESVFETTSCVRDGDERKGLSWAQGSGCCISYLRKYVMCGMLLVDDGTDDDAISGNPNTTAAKKKDKPTMTLINNAQNKEALMQIWNGLTKEEKEIFKPVFTERKKKLGIK